VTFEYDFFSVNNFSEFFKGYRKKAAAFDGLLTSHAQSSTKKTLKNAYSTIRKHTRIRIQTRSTNKSSQIEQTSPLVPPPGKLKRKKLVVFDSDLLKLIVM